MSKKTLEITNDELESLLHLPLREQNPQKEKERSSVPAPASPPTLIENQRAHIIELLTCAVCMDACLPPLMQCTKGHLVCNTCIDNLVKYGNARQCPTCRTDFSADRRSRNLMLEQIVAASDLRVACPRGCANIAFAEMEAHERACPLKIPEIRCVEPGCYSSVPVNKYAEHINTKHAGSRQLKADRGVVLLNSPVELHFLEPREHKAFSGMTKLYFLQVNTEGSREPSAYLFVCKKQHSNRTTTYLIQVLWSCGNAPVVVTLSSVAPDDSTALVYRTNGRAPIVKTTGPPPTGTAPPSKIELLDAVDAGVTVSAVRGVTMTLSLAPKGNKRARTDEEDANEEEEDAGVVGAAIADNDAEGDI